MNTHEGVPHALPQDSVDQTDAAALDDRLTVAVSGTFRRAGEDLRRDVRQLCAAGCRLVSPVDLNFISEVDGFAYARHELSRSPAEIEREHLDALRAVDLVWLHAPDGYLGPSGAFELGVALTSGIPIFGRHSPADVGLREFVHTVHEPAEAARQCRTRTLHAAGAPLDGLQRYYARVASARGWDNEGPADCMLLLTEEMGELARAVRAQLAIARDETTDTNLPDELADVQLYLVHLANVLAVDLADAVTRKEVRNARRHALRRASAA
jgi:NTP pyrophosphatase (non-canonical NTP hydrolase)